MDRWEYKKLKSGDLTRVTGERLVEIQKIIDEVLVPKDERTVENTLVPLNNADILLSNVLHRLYQITDVHPVAKLRGSASTNVQRIISLNSKLGLDPKLYEAVSGVDVSLATFSTKRFKQKLLRDFRRSGTDKDEATRKKIMGMREKIARLGLEFVRNINDAVNEIEAPEHELRGIPQSVISAFGRRGDKYVITTNYPDSFPVLQFCQSEKLRKAMDRAMNTRAPQNEGVLKQLVATRHALAQILGYENWAVYEAEIRMTGSAGRIEEFIKTLGKDTKKSALKEAELLLGYMRRDGIADDFIGDWNRLYYAEVDKRERGDYNSQEFMEYFPYTQVKEGILDVYADLFDIEFVRNHDMHVWHRSVECYDILERGELLGRIYLDMHPRKGKHGHASAVPIVSGIANRQVPEVMLMCNFPGGRKKDGAALMQFDQVSTFFHEFGHLLHGIFAGKHKWAEFSGIKTERDFAETPSQLLEEWLFDPQVLRRIGRHYKSGEVIPESLIVTLRVAEEFGKALYVRRQIFLSAVSFYLYATGEDASDVWRAMEDKYSPFVHDKKAHHWTSWGHLGGYSSNYYVYMWSLAIAKDLLTGFDTENLMDKQIARKYRETILEPGGSRDAADMVQDFLGRPYNFNAFRAWLDS